jgi:hypothetical protein
MNTTVIYGTNLSDAWAKAFLKCFDAPGAVLSPAAVSFPARDNVADLEILGMREMLDSHLRDPSKYPPGQSVVNTIANTIFPQSTWLLSRGDRQKFYETYIKTLPRIRKCRANMRGIYFERMIAYPSHESGERSINQLEHVISTWQGGNHRHSALQLGIFNPTCDHTDARRQGFPCLQQVSFHPNGSNGRDGLSVVAFYANQTLEEKAYGNYLGLYRLGQFVANAMGIKIKDVTCIASALKLNNAASKGSCRELVDRLRMVIDNETD